LPINVVGLSAPKIFEKKKLERLSFPGLCNGLLSFVFCLFFQHFKKKTGLFKHGRTPLFKKKTDLHI